MSDLASPSRPALPGLKVVAVRRGTLGADRLSLLVPATLLALLVVACVAGPFIFSLPNPSTGSLIDARMGLFSPGHLLGTDALGNDLFSRALHGGQISFFVSVVSVSLGLLAGAALGILTAFSRGLAESALLRLVDIQVAFPSIVLALALAAYLGPGVRNVIIALAVFNIPANARLTRAVTRRVLAMDYIANSRLAGARPRYIVTHHVVPNIWGELLTYNVTRIGNAMIVEATLSFLGVGVQPPTPSWGSMISSGAQDMASYPYIFLVPAVFLFVAILLVNLTGDQVRARWEAR